MKNLRKNKRQECIVPVEGKEGSAFGGTQAVDLSKGGIGLISKKRIPVKRQIAVELDLSIDGDPIFAIGEVQWVKKIKGSENYRVGMSFKDIVGGSKSRLSKFFSQ